MQSTDEERPESIAMGNNEQRIYMLTETGILVIFSTETLAIVYQRPFHRIGKEIIPSDAAKRSCSSLNRTLSALTLTLNEPTIKLSLSIQLSLTRFSASNSPSMRRSLRSAPSPPASLRSRSSLLTTDSSSTRTSDPPQTQSSSSSFSVDNDYMMTEDIKGNVNFFEMHTDRNIDEKAIDF